MSDVSEYVLSRGNHFYSIILSILRNDNLNMYVLGTKFKLDSLISKLRAFFLAIVGKIFVMFNLRLSYAFGHHGNIYSLHPELFV